MKNDDLSRVSDSRIPTAQEIQERIEQLRQRIEEIKLRLSAERQLGKPDKNKIQQQIHSKQSELDEIQSKINKAKSQAKKRKREISDWKQWFHTLAETDRSTELAKLTFEIDWRGVEINVRQDEIAVLEGQKWAVTGELESLKHQIFALEQGVYDRPVEDDPRLINAQAACDKEIAVLTATLSV